MRGGMQSTWLQQVAGAGGFDGTCDENGVGVAIRASFYCMLDLLPRGELRKGRGKTAPCKVSHYDSCRSATGLVRGMNRNVKSAALYPIIPDYSQWTLTREVAPVLESQTWCVNFVSGLMLCHVSPYQWLASLIPGQKGPLHEHVAHPCQ